LLLFFYFSFLIFFLLFCSPLWAGALVNRLDTDGDSALNRDEFSTASQMMRRQFRDDAPASNATGGSD